MSAVAASDARPGPATGSRWRGLGLGARLFYVTLDGFDTHAAQAGAHATLLREVSDAISELRGTAPTMAATPPSQLRGVA